MAKHKDFSELFDPSKPMLEVRNLTRLYPQKGGSLFRKPKQVHAVDGVSFTLQEREIFGVIGESGCGKSTLGRLLIRLEEPTSGEIDFYGISTKKLLEANPEQFHCLVQSVFQNPFDTFTPSDTIGAIMERPPSRHWPSRRPSVPPCRCSGEWPYRSGSEAPPPRRRSGAALPGSWWCPDPPPCPAGRT